MGGEFGAWNVSAESVLEDFQGVFLGTSSRASSSREAGSAESRSTKSGQKSRICKAHLLPPVKISRVVHGSLLIDNVRFLRKLQISLAKMAYFNVNHWGFTGTKS